MALCIYITHDYIPIPEQPLNINLFNKGVLQIACKEWLLSHLALVRSKVCRDGNVLSIWKKYDVLVGMLTTVLSLNDSELMVRGSCDS